MEHIYHRLSEIVGEHNILQNENMGKHTTFKTGGNAKYLIEPDDETKLARLIKYVNDNNLKNYIIGNGSNLLVRDEGFDGIIIKIGSKLSDIRVEEEYIICQAGTFVSKLASVACENSLTGLEFAAGIPGMVGGAIAMNAGAYGGEFKDVVEEVCLLDVKGNQIYLNKEEMKFGYRSSIVQNKNYIVTSVKLRLDNGNKDKIREKMEENLKARREKQPLEYPSAGSTFKRPSGYFAGKLIMDSGLAGYTIGGACVSEKHCGFIINKDNAKASDIIALIDNVTEVVLNKFGVKLEPEVKII